MYLARVQGIRHAESPSTTRKGNQRPASGAKGSTRREATAKTRIQGEVEVIVFSLKVQEDERVIFTQAILCLLGYVIWIGRSVL